MATIPNEYAGFDFGFTFINEPDTNVPDTTPNAPAVNTDDITGPILERLRSLEINVGEVLSTLERLEQISTPDLDTEEYKALIEKDIKEKLHNVEAMVMPLLTNLLKDADTKEYIKWPNRRHVIESFIEKFLTITRS